MSDCNVFPFRNNHIPTRERLVEAISFEQFCQADAAGEWETRHHVNGTIILQYPRIIMTCCASGNCAAIRQIGTDLDVYFNEALSALDQVA